MCVALVVVLFLEAELNHSNQGESMVAEIQGTLEELTQLLSCVAPFQSVDAQVGDCFLLLSVQRPESLTAVPQCR